MGTARSIGPGDVINVQFTKWGGGGHWEFPLNYLGTDHHGTWGGGTTGTTLSRPGNSFDSKVAWVTLFPHEQPWCASFYDAPIQDIVVYVDMTTVPRWSGAEVTMVDLDLDVVLLRDGSLFVDDEDEFDEHRVQLSYPDDLVQLARTTAGSVLESIAHGAEPFNSVWKQWLAHFSSRVGTGRS